MDPQQFDTLTKSFANGLSRRKALTRLGGAAAIFAALGRDRVEAAPLAATPATCTLTFVGNVRLGPSAGQVLRGKVPGELSGQLTLPIDDKGAVTQGKMRLSDGTTLTVVGQANGRAVNLRIAAGNNRAIVAMGTADQDLTRCKGAVDGVLTGPQTGDLGDWHATLSAGAAAGGALVTVVNGATAPAAPPPPPQNTQPTTIGCAHNTTACNGNCVDLHSDAGNCGNCGFACPDGVSCVGAICCNSGTAPCTNDKFCCDGPCVNGHCQPGGSGGGATATAQACPSGQAMCNGSCMDVLSDPANCGSCGKACSTGIPCVGGQCSCPPALSVCNGKCTDTTSDAANCGSCGNACQSGQSCVQSQCQ